MWKLCENSDSIKPSEIDEVSSKAVVFVRKDFKEIPMLNDDGEEIGTRWQYLENIVNKANWEIYKQVIENQNATTDIELAICDLYELVTGGAS